jgi:hypothetical protein
VPGLDIAIVSSFFPRAALPASDVPKAQRSLLEKSSLNKISPISGFNISVAVITGVEKGVGVAVAGNQTTVSVGETVEVITGISDGKGIGVPVGKQAYSTNESNPTINTLTRAVRAACQEFSSNCFSHFDLVNSDNALVYLG